MAKRAGRQRSQLPTCYYEGYLEKRSFKDKTSRKLWACLCGDQLFFFNEKRDNNYVEKLDLSGLISVTDDNSTDRNLDAARLNLQMKDGNIKFTAPSAESRELWKGYIHSVSELAIPSSLNLLPGQIHMLKEVVEKEKERRENAAAASTPSIYISFQPDMPACYYSVSRLEAELLLEREVMKGNLLLRPGRDGNSFAVTTRQDLDGAIFKHYRVSRKPEGGFIIELQNPVPCTSLHEVINYLMEQTDGVMIPLVMEQPYERTISFISSDNENGEKTIQQASVKSTSSPAVPHKPAFAESDNESGEKTVPKGLPNSSPPAVPPKPVSIKIPTSEPVPDSEEDDSLYMNVTLEEEKETEDSPAAPLSQLKTKPSKKLAVPPVPAPRNKPSSSTSSTNKDLRQRTNSDLQMPFAALSELKLKLNQKLQTQE